VEVGFAGLLVCVAVAGSADVLAGGLFVPLFRFWRIGIFVLFRRPLTRFFQTEEPFVCSG
jgi:hypothetical protein